MEVTFEGRIQGIGVDVRPKRAPHDFIPDARQSIDDVFIYGDRHVIEQALEKRDPADGLYVHAWR